jgi:hypothetical protein
METNEGTCPRSSNLSLEIEQTDAERRSRLETPHKQGIPSHPYYVPEVDDNITNPDYGFTPARTMQPHQNPPSTDKPLTRCPRPNQLVDRRTKSTTRRGYVENILFPIETFHLLQDRGWLPEAHKSYRLDYEPDRNRLLVHMVLPAHDAAANAWNDEITYWNTNGVMGRTLCANLGKDV